MRLSEAFSPEPDDYEFYRLSRGLLAYDLLTILGAKGSFFFFFPLPEPLLEPETWVMLWSFKLSEELLPCDGG
mgnify:CR=1 FL=1